MRKLVAGLFTSLDGVVGSPERWQGPYFTEEVGAELGSQMGQSDTMLLGRRTYEEFAAYWPNEGRSTPFGEYMNATPKYVLSTDRELVPGWENSHRLAGDPAAAVLALKQQDGRDIQITGSVSVVRWTIRAGLLDRLDLLVCPLLVGSGLRLFEDTGGSAPASLLEVRALANGVLSSSYDMSSIPSDAL